MMTRCAGEVSSLKGVRTLASTPAIGSPRIVSNLLKRGGRSDRFYVKQDDEPTTQHEADRHADH